MHKCPAFLVDTTAMCWACRRGDLALLEELVRGGADVNAQDYDLRTPLHLAVSDNQPHLVKFLLAHGARVDNCDRWGRSPLDCAQDPTIRNLLLQLPGATSLPSTPTLTTKVFDFVRNGDTESLKRAWLDGVPLDLSDGEDQRTPLHVAVDSQQLDVIELLVSAGANINALDNSHQTPMSLAIQQRYIPAIELFRSYQLSHDSNNKKNKSKPDQTAMTLAFDAVITNHLDALKKLVPQYLHPDVEDYDKRTLLHIASSEGHLQIVTYLIEFGANTNLTDRWGNTPLSEAIDFSHQAVATYLRQHGAQQVLLPNDAPHPIENTEVFDDALEYILRAASQDKWYFGEVHSPVPDSNVGSILLLHSVWHLNPNFPNANPDAITKFRKASGLLPIDSGEGLVGRVLRTQQTEWTNSLSCQSIFLRAPYARWNRLETALSVPLLYLNNIQAILTWFTTQKLDKDEIEIHRIQRLISSVVVLIDLKEKIEKISHYQYCQAIEKSITGHGELFQSSIDLRDVQVNDVISLVLDWQLFDRIDKLATSMSSEDHEASLNVLFSLSKLVVNGFFTSVKENYSLSQLEEHMVETISSPISNKVDLLSRLFYYGNYLKCVSPTEGAVFTKSRQFLHQLESYMNDSLEAIEVKVEKKQEEVSKSNEPECVLCKFNVPGHIHKNPNGPPKKTPADSPPPIPLENNVGGGYFSQMGHPMSPVMKEIMQLRQMLLSEYEQFSGREELMKSIANWQQLNRSSIDPKKVSASDVYDAIGSKHAKSAANRRSFGFLPPPSSNEKTSMEEIIKVSEEILADESNLLTLDQILRLHGCLELAKEDKGRIRDESAVGYASSRIYRVFCPWEEVKQGLVFFLKEIEKFPNGVLQAYYVYACLIFYLHPFVDGNGRVGRLLANLISRKTVFGRSLNLFPHQNKTMQLTPFLSDTKIKVYNIQTTTYKKNNKKNNQVSMWF